MDADRMRRLSETVAIVGVGDTDYPIDYERMQEAKRHGERWLNDPYDLAIEAFRRALADCGIDKNEVDGLGVAASPTDINYERVAELLGLTLTWGGEIS